VTAPGPNGGTRKVAFTRAQRGKITRITDPDGKFVSFTYGSSTGVTITGRTNRNNFTQTFTLASNRIVQATLPLTATTSATSVFCPVELRGLVSGGCGTSGPIAPESAVTTIDGPRPSIDVNDITTIATDRFGGPFVVTDALGSSTRLYHSNRAMPGLVTRTVAKNGWVNDAFYDEKGLVTVRVEYAPLGPGRDAVTTFQWDPKWERITQIAYPEGNVVRFAYDDSTGNRIWQEDGRGTVSRVNFRYYTSGSGDRLLRAAEYPTQISIGDRDSVEYDANGNVAHVRQVSGNLVWAARHFVNDGAGRTTSACLDIDIAGNGGQQCRLSVYDVMDRDSIVTDSGPPMFVNNMQNTPAQSVRVASFYDNEGNLTKVERTAKNAGVPAGIGTLATQWEYDRANRRVKEIAGDGAPDSLVYDAAGNNIQFISRRTDPINPASHLMIDMAYDALNRLTRRTLPPVSYPARTGQGIPAVATSNGDTLSTKPYPRLLTNASGGLTILGDTETFTYDERGAIRSANNGDARVTRAYYDNGLIKAETLAVRTYDGSDFSKHVYTTSYEYDLNGRRSALTYPTQLTTTAGGTFNRARYQYDAGTGALATVTDVQNNVFTLAYDRQARVDSIMLSGGIVQRFLYDGASRLVNDIILNRNFTTADHFRDTTLRFTTLGYNSRGDLKLTANVIGKRDTLVAEYYGLGYLAASDYSEYTPTLNGGTVRGTSSEGFSRDGLANDTTARTTITNASSQSFERTVGRRNTRYQPGTGRQVLVRHIDPNAMLLRSDSLLYDESGNVVFSWTTFVAPATPQIREDRAMYYSADGRLRVVDHRTATVNGPTGIFVPITFDFDEHRYDALGRRVLTRTQRECVINMDYVVCGLSTIRRTVWDGSQELIEIQQPGHTGASAEVLENDTAFAARIPIYRPGGVNADLNWFYGRVAYTFGAGLDQPMSVTRWGFQRDSAGQLAQWREPFTIVPHWNVRGGPDNGAFADGSTRNCNSTAQSYCVALEWPFGWTAHAQKFFQPRMWHGSLLEEKRDGSGLVFKRNRYLDPATGKFTQEDPIGLSGGLNLYGFANGDPVNFRDPFGLWPDLGELLMRVRNWLYHSESGQLATAVACISGCVPHSAEAARALRTAQTKFPTLLLGLRGAGPTPPDVPEGMSRNDFGEKFLQWGTGNAEARAKIGAFNRETLENAGVTHVMAQQWANFYKEISRLSPKNPSAAGRADLMQHIADLLK
jgi:RHS repeat-associated protein